NLRLFQQIRERAGFQQAKRRLSVSFNDLSRRAPVGFRDECVQIYRRASEPARELLGNGRLGATHEPNQNDATVRHLSTTELNRSKKSGNETATQSGFVISLSPSAINAATVKAMAI